MIGQTLAVAHLPVETIPTGHRHRVAASTRLRPVLAVAALSLAVTGLVLQAR